MFEGFDGMRFYKWKGNGYSTKGKKEEKNGGVVQVYGPSSTPDPDEAHEKLVAKMEEENEFIKFLPYSFLEKHCNVPLTKTDEVFKGVPLANFQHNTRGDVFEATVRSFLSEKLKQEVEDAPITLRVNGASRGKNQTSCDFVINGERVEVKSCMMQWESQKNLWQLEFKRVNKEEYDVLYLAWMSKKGIHIMKHDGKAGIGEGREIQFCAPSGKNGLKSLSEAEEFLLIKMEKLGLEYTAFLKFGKGLQERIMEIVMADKDENEEQEKEQQYEEEEEYEEDEDEEYEIEEAGTQRELKRR